LTGLSEILCLRLGLKAFGLEDLDLGQPSYQR